MPLGKELKKVGRSVGAMADGRGRHNFVPYDLESGMVVICIATVDGREKTVRTKRIAPETLMVLMLSIFMVCSQKSNLYEKLWHSYNNII